MSQNFFKSESLHESSKLEIGAFSMGGRGKNFRGRIFFWGGGGKIF